MTRIKRMIILLSILLSIVIILLLIGVGSDRNTGESSEMIQEDYTEQTIIEESISEEESMEILADMTQFSDMVPLLKDGYSELVGPWAYCFYAKDERTDFIYHDAYDGYVPQAGDLLVTGDDEDLLYVDRRAKENITGLGEFDYWFDDEAWNGHILYIAENNNGILICHEGNTIAPGQDLSIDDEDYIYLSSIDTIEIIYDTSEVLTPEKTGSKEIRAVIETAFPDEFVKGINYTAHILEEEFNEAPDTVRAEIMDLYPAGIDWCGLYIHYLLLRTVAS